jgi:DNA polymerase-1
MANTETKIKIARWLIDPENHRKLPTDLEMLEAELNKLGLRRIYEDIELPLYPILQAMHKTGIAVHVSYLKKLELFLTKKIELLVKKIYQLAGESFNLNSPKQLAFILFEKLKVGKSGFNKKTKSGNYSTDVETLQLIAKEHPIVPLVLKYRELWKIQSTYVKPLLKLIGDDGRIHTTFSQTGTSTGRLTSQEPNLQNIPALGEWGKKIRKAFVAKKNFSFLAADYSQIELRVLASLADDEKMIEAFKKGVDIHRLTASQIWSIPINKVTPTMRAIAKTLNFGIIYGMGPDAFSRTSGLSREKAEKFIAEYFSNFSKIKIWQEKLIEKVRSLGYAENLNGRKRYLPEINSPDRFKRAAAERAAINMVVQSLASDIIKLAMIEISKFIREKKLEKKVKLLLSIHDELLFEIENDILKKTARKIYDLMTKVYSLKVSLEVELKTGKNWGEMKTIKNSIQTKNK